LMQQSVIHFRAEGGYGLTFTGPCIVIYSYNKSQ